MARGDFGVAFGLYRKKGGQLSRKEFSEQIWKPALDKSTLIEEVKVESESVGKEA